GNALFVHQLAVAAGAAGRFGRYTACQRGRATWLPSCPQGLRPGQGLRVLRPPGRHRFHRGPRRRHDRHTRQDLRCSLAVASPERSRGPDRETAVTGRFAPGNVRIGGVMKIGIGLPNAIKGLPGRRLVEWAQRAEERGFAGLTTVDRVAYPTYDSLAT